MLNEKIYLREDTKTVFVETYIIKDPLGEDRKKPLVVVCPGGGYNFCSEREAEPVALKFNSAGFHAVILRYSVNTLFPEALRDLSDTVALVRENAERWNVLSDKIIVCGFSAGGHLAASLGVFWNSEESIIRADEKNKPNGLILSYPVITSSEKTHYGSVETISGGDKALLEKVSLEKRVNKDTPPTFIWHTFADELVPVENSLVFMTALAKEKIKFEAHIYPDGPHGLSLANEYVAKGMGGVLPEVQEWIENAIRWVKSI